MIRVQIASIPDREKMLKKTIESLRPQVNEIWVGLNRYKRKPRFLGGDECEIFDNSTGDAVKFYNAEKHDGWMLTCDDDLIYPPDYVHIMTSKVVQYQSPVTLHGKNYPRPIRTFAHILEKFPCLDDVNRDVKVDIPGTGVLCYHTNLIKVRYADFRLANMADLWFAKLCINQGVDVYCIAHKKGYLTYQNPQETIWQVAKEAEFKVQTEILKSIL